MSEPLDTSPLHELWSLAVGLPGYDKSKWKQLEAKLETAIKPLAARDAEVARLRERVTELEEEVKTYERALDDE